MGRLIFENICYLLLLKEESNINKRKKNIKRCFFYENVLLKDPNSMTGQ